MEANNFIEDIINEELAEGVNTVVHTERLSARRARKIAVP